MSRNENGASLREHLESVYKQTGQKPDLLADEVRLPMWAATIWDLFVTLSATRAYVNDKARAILPTEIDMHCRLCGIELSRIEYRLLLQLDRIYLRVENGR